MRKTVILFTLLCSLAAVNASAAHLADTYVIPVASSTPGAFGSTWATDIAVTNFSATALNVQLLIIETGENQFDNLFPVMTAEVPDGNFTVGPNSTRLLRDVLRGHRGQTSTVGALIVGADRPFAITARSYNSLGGNTVGETITPVRDFFENATGQFDGVSVAYLPGLVNNGLARTNIGFVSASGSATGGFTVEVTVKNAAGAVLGTRRVTNLAGNFTHTQFSLASITNQFFDVGSAEVRILGGSGVVIPYAAVIDNRTQSVAYIMGIFPGNTPLTNSMNPSVFRSLLNRFQSSVR